MVKKIVRKQTLWNRLSSLPFDFWLSSSEYLELVDWDSKAYSVAIPSGAICNVLLLICRLYGGKRRNVDSLFSDSESVETLSFISVLVSKNLGLFYS
jgi:hypothetical protein